MTRVPEETSPGSDIWGSEKTHLVTLVTQQPKGVRKPPAYGIASTCHKQKDDAIGLIDNAIIGSTTRVPEKTSLGLDIWGSEKTHLFT